MSTNSKDAVALINKAKADMTRLGIPEEEQTIEAICIFAKAEQLSESKRIRETSTIGVIDYDYDF